MRDLADELLQAQVKARLFGGDHAPRLGRLVLLERVGAGAMGTVYTAYDPKLDRKVAVKVLHDADFDDTTRFLTEARTLAKLAHPHVVTIHDVGERDDAVYIVMELAPGVPLRAWIGEPREWRDVVRVMREIADGLAAAHRAGVVHRDIKPDNILVGDRARLVDFGLAHAGGASDGAGTPSYMAPEVLAGGAATPASDQFSFGVTLFEALHGERPYAGATRAELEVAARNAAKATTRRSSRSARRSSPADARAATDLAPATPDPRAVRPEPVPTPDTKSSVPTADAARVPAWVMAIVRRALAAEPEERFPSMEALAAELGRDRVRRRRAIVLVAAALAIGGGIGGVAMRARTEPAELASCSGTERRVAVWSDARAERIRGVLGDTAWAAATVRSLDHTARQWETSFEHVCAATRVTGEQSDRLLELRMRCLDRALARFDALATAMSGPLDSGTRPSARARVEAASAPGELPPPEHCERLVDEAELALPADPAARSEALAAERELDTAWAAFALARYSDARARAAAVDARLAKLDAPAQRAAALALAGSIEARIGEPAAARETLDRALVAAAAARASELEYAVWSRLLRHELFAGVPARAVDQSVFARAAAARAGRDGGDVDAIVAEALRKTGKLGKAREHARRALASRDPMSADQRALIEMNLGSIDLAAGKSTDAEAAFRRGLAAATATLGDDHPTLGLYLDKLAHAAVARGRIRDALALHDRSLALRRRAFGETDRAVATARFYRGQTLIEAGDLARARDDLDAAFAIRARVYGERSPRLGEIVAAQGDLAAARGDATAARASWDRAAQLDPRLADAWSSDAAAAGDLAIDRVSAAAARIARMPRDPARVAAAALHARWRAAGPIDAAMSLPVADALRAAGDPDTATAVYTDALHALANEPSRTRLRLLHALASSEERDLAAAVPDLANDLGSVGKSLRVCRECDPDRVLPRPPR